MSRRVLFSAAAVLAAALLVPLPAVLAAGSLFVSPSGSDTNAGTSAAQPLGTLQAALDKAGPGTTVRLAAGRYLQDARTSHPGVTVTGPPEAVVSGAGNGRIFEINHDDTTLSGFTIDGLAGAADSKAGYRDKLVFVIGTRPGDGVSGTRLTGMTLRNAGGECIRLKYLASGADISGNRIGPCGVYDFRFGDGGKNGEGVYIGTAPEQLGKNPDSRRDVSTGIKVHDNRIDTRGNECVDIKEGATGNDVFANDCTGQLDPESGGMDSRGGGNTFRGNRIHDNVGAGIRFGGDQAGDGTGNDAVGNQITGNKAGGIKFQAAPQGDVCGNTFAGNGAADAVGAKAAGFKPAAPCPAGVGGPAPTSSTVAGSTTSSTVAGSTTSSTVAGSTTSSTVAGSTTSSTVAGRPVRPGRAHLRLRLRELIELLIRLLGGVVPQLGAALGRG